MHNNIVIVNPTPALQRVTTMESLVRNEVNRAGHVEILASGKGLNCARACSAMGQRATLVTLLGGETGTWFERCASREHVRLEFIGTDTPTRICTTIVEKESNSVTELVENAGAVTAGEAADYVQLVKEQLPGSAVVVLIGTLPPGFPPDLYEELIKFAKSRDIFTIVDTQGEALLRGVQAGPTLVKLNRKELGEAVGMDCTSQPGLIEGTAILRSRGAGAIMVTDGPRATYLVTDSDIISIMPPGVEEQNPIGSGDSVAAGIACSMTQGPDLNQAVKMGIACGAANAAAYGYGRFPRKLADQLRVRIHLKTVTD